MKMVESQGTVLSIFMLSFIFCDSSENMYMYVIFFEWKQICAGFFIPYVYIHFVCITCGGDQVVKRGGLGYLLLV